MAINPGRAGRRDLPHSNEALAILHAVSGLGTGLHLVTTAEGVETQSQLDAIDKEGYAEAQGYFFSKPLSVSQITGFLHSLSNAFES